jgi:hypothetical protein
VPAQQAAEQDPLDATDMWNCFCEILHEANTSSTPCTMDGTGCDLWSCQNDVNAVSTANGWCYVDDSGATPLGNPAIVKNCPSTEKRQLRFVGSGSPVSGSTVFITCEGT